MCLLEVYYPDDPTRLCRPKAGQSLVLTKFHKFSTKADKFDQISQFLQVYAVWTYSNRILIPVEEDTPLKDEKFLRPLSKFSYRLPLSSTKLP